MERRLWADDEVFYYYSDCKEYQLVDIQGWSGIIRAEPEKTLPATAEERKDARECDGEEITEITLEAGLSIMLRFPVTKHEHGYDDIDEPTTPSWLVPTFYVLPNRVVSPPSDTQPQQRLRRTIRRSSSSVRSVPYHREIPATLRLPSLHSMVHPEDGPFPPDDSRKRSRTALDPSARTASSHC